MEKESMDMKNYIIISLKICMILFFVNCTKIYADNELFGINLKTVYQESNGSFSLLIDANLENNIIKISVKNDINISIVEYIYNIRSKPFKPLIIFNNGYIFIVSDNKLMIINCREKILVVKNSVFEAAMYLVDDKIFLEPAYATISGMEINYKTIVSGPNYRGKRPFSVDQAIRAKSPIELYR